jgi:predicted dehydrogenase
VTRAAVVGTGFIGVVHVEALRRLGVEVVGVVGSSPERARAKPGLPEPFESFEAMLADERVDVVHLTTPNHLHFEQARAVLDAGKHVVCEKPLALDSRQSAELVRVAEASGLVHCVNFNLRFYPQCHEARALVRAGAIGEVWNVHGGYLQDWLLLPTDWNWRLDAALGGELRAVADIGSHWLDLAQFVTGLRVEAVCADLFTTVPVRRKPTGPVEAFATAGDGEREGVQMTSEDAANVLVRFAGGARGSFVVSQVSAGRKNSLSLEVDGSRGSLAWSSERNEELWRGHRERPSEVAPRDPSQAVGTVPGSLPAGHPEGFADTFKELYRAVYRAVEAGGAPAEPDYPTFRDGHVENVLGDAIALSSRDRRWVDVEG